MGFALRLLSAASVLLCASLPAGAQRVAVQIGPQVVCDTQQQIERFVALFDGDFERAAAAVNDEAKNPVACSLAVVAYVPGEEISTTRAPTGTYHIVRILVLGIVTEAGLQAAVPASFYGATRVKELGA